MPQHKPVVMAIDELPAQGRYLRRVWWAVIWRIVLWQVLLLTVVIYATEHWLLNYPYLRHTFQTFSLLGVFPFGYLALKAVVNKPFKGFRLALLSTEVAPPVEGDVATQQENTEKPDTNTPE